ncbi:VWA domain-containing protein [Candidatus Woesearchaeota archaeon]|nr:VWA domain-containing protein [Candidatus Woesearchaeota archaeon]
MEFLRKISRFCLTFLACLGLYSCGEDTIVNNYYSSKDDSISEDYVGEDSITIDDCTKYDYAPDKDGDGFGNMFKSETYCVGFAPQGWVLNASDCDDSNKDVNPNAVEICDSLDNNCDGQNDNSLDLNCCSSVGEIKSTDYCPPHDFIFVIDNSGSMDTNDPDDMRYFGLHDFVDKMNNSNNKQLDRSTVIPFTTSAKLIGPLTSDNLTLHYYLDEAQLYSPSSGTKIGSAMQEAFNSFENTDQRRVIILLTDGETGDSIPDYKLSQEAESKNIRVFTLGLGSSIDEDYLSSVATSKGSFYKINSADQIIELYNELFNLLKYKTYYNCNESLEWELIENEC